MTETTYSALGSARHHLPSRVADLVGEIARKHDVTVADILGPSHLPEHAKARHEAAHWLRQMVWAGKAPSYPQIGRWLNRDHTSILHGCRRHAERIEGNPSP